MTADIKGFPNEYLKFLLAFILILDVMNNKQSLQQQVCITANTCNLELKLYNKHISIPANYLPDLPY